MFSKRFSTVQECGHFLYFTVFRSPGSWSDLWSKLPRDIALYVPLGTAFLAGGLPTVREGSMAGQPGSVSCLRGPHIPRRGICGWRQSAEIVHVGTCGRDFRFPDALGKISSLPHLPTYRKHRASPPPTRSGRAPIPAWWVLIYVGRR